MGRGRPVDGRQRIGGSDGSVEAKQRTETVVAYLARELTAAEAGERLGIGVSRFHEIVKQSLQGMVEANEQGSAGRPPARTPELIEVERLQGQVAKLERDLEITRIVEQSRWVPTKRDRPKKR
jgi:hypothetical protein